MPAAWIERLAESFWGSVGGPPIRPRDLAPLITRTTDVVLVQIRDLCLSAARSWFDRRGVTVPVAGNDRPVKGLVVAFGGRGVIFVEMELPTDERRVILAHEFAHYLVEYLQPRNRLTRRLGDELCQHLDGQKPLEAPHEWAALLAGVPLRMHTHFLARENSDDWLPQVERTANELALELLAPHKLVLADLRGTPPNRDEICEWLIAKYGLPLAWASGYAVTIADSHSRRRPFSERLGL